MIIRTGLKAGLGAVPEDAQMAVSQNSRNTSAPYINNWMTCYRCSGKKDSYGNVSKGTCQACWPIGSPSPVG
jgi:hypothetical protein